MLEGNNLLTCSFINCAFINFAPNLFTSKPSNSWSSSSSRDFLAGISISFVGKSLLFMIRLGLSIFNGSLTFFFCFNDDNELERDDDDEDDDDEHDAVDADRDLLLDLDFLFFNSDFLRHAAADNDSFLDLE